MIQAWRFQERLSRAQIQWRAAILAGITGGLILLRAIDASKMPGWLGSSVSCGAATGVPCLFCGVTRGLHYLLNGDFSRALYLNWLTFPIFLALAVFSALLFLELTTKRRIAWPFAKLRVTPRGIFVCAVALVLLWTVQVGLAVSQHKRELLNPAGPLYSLFVN